MQDGVPSKKLFRWIFLWVTALSIAVYVIYAHFQPTYTYSLLDSRYDAHKYALLYHFFKGNAADFQVSFPFNSRILMPWLAAQLPFQDIKTAFIWLNGLFIVPTIGLLAFSWQKLHIRPLVIFVGIFWVLFHWKGIVRMYLPDPVTADVGSYFFQTIWLGLIGVFIKQSNDLNHKNDLRWILSRFNYPTISLVVILGTLQKESFIAVVIASFIYVLFLPNRRFPFFFILLFSVSPITYLSANYYFPAVSDDWRNNPFVSILRGIKRYAFEPTLFLKLPISWFLAYGTFWIVIIEKWNKDGWKKENTSHFSLLASLLWLFLSIFGGGDTTRILFNGMPFILTFLLLKLNQKPAWLSWYVFITSLPLMRLFSLEPDLGLYPQSTHHWCVECWQFSESWGYWMYAVVVLMGYYYLARRLGIGSGEPNEVETSR